jgi:hypothetical protein
MDQKQTGGAMSAIRSGEWTPARERRAIVAHVARCRFCAALLSHGATRQDRAILDAAEALLSQHVSDEEERAALAQSRPRTSAGRR